MKSFICFILCILAISSLAEAKLNVLIVYAHQEPKSFCAAMKDTCVKTLTDKGHDVVVTDLYKLGMFNRLDKSDFTELYDPTYFRPQDEQLAANKKNRTTFVEELRREHDRAEWADAILFIYPLYLGYVPGIVQAWMERVMSRGFAFGGDVYHLKGKRVMLVYSTGAPKAAMEKVTKIMQLILYTCYSGMQMVTLDPFAAYGISYNTEEDRKKYLQDLAEVMNNLA